jgi:hypothetical protein
MSEIMTYLAADPLRLGTWCFVCGVIFGWCWQAALRRPLRRSVSQEK